MPPAGDDMRAPDLQSPLEFAAVDRADPVDAATKAAGTGLGLAIFHRIVSDHGGTIAVESRPGRTVFTVTLPCGERAAVAPCVCWLADLPVRCCSTAE